MKIDPDTEFYKQSPIPETKKQMLLRNQELLPMPRACRNGRRHTLNWSIEKCRKRSCYIFMHDVCHPEQTSIAPSPWGVAKIIKGEGQI